MTAVAPAALRGSGLVSEAGTGGALEATTVMAMARGENFPVASRLLPRRVRAHLMALYGFARLADQAGDAAEGERLAVLDELEEDLGRVWDSQPRHPLLIRLQPTVRQLDLAPGPFRRLIEANRLDQVKRRYETFDELLDYCSLSANPVGELVLGVFGAATPERVRHSDAICSALQLAEHWQDVAEDRRAGRIYLPAEDLRAHGVAESDLDPAHAPPALRRLLAAEVERAHLLLDQGAPLLGMLSGRPRLAVAAFIAGGRAALHAIEHADYDVLSAAPRAKGAQRVRELARVLARGGARRP